MVQLARQLAAELDIEFEMEIASHAPAVNVDTGFVHRVVHISNDESNDEIDMEEWSDDPEHAKLVETARKLREQEKEDEDEDVAKKYQEIYDKNNGPREEDREVAMMYQKLYDQNSTEVEIASVTEN